MNLVNISKLTSKKSLYEIKKEVDTLLQQNLNDIAEKNKTSFIMPLNIRSIMCLYAAYVYKVPIITMTALFQLYANDLIVIVLTILRSKNLEDSFLKNCTILLNKFKHQQVEDMTSEMTNFYTLLVHNIYDNKIYIPADLW